MRIKRQVRWEGLSEDQKQRALEAQKRYIQRYNSRTVPWLVNQTANMNIVTSNYVNDRRYSRMSGNMTFEEKYNVKPMEEPKYATIRDLPKVEDEPVPPSLEEDPNQHSPLKDDMLDLEIGNEDAEDNSEKERERLSVMTLKELKEEYKKYDTEKHIDYINNKTKMIDLILEQISNGTSKEG